MTGAELGLAVAQLGERAGDREAIFATPLGDRPPAASLGGLRVVDLSSLWAGPLCGALLAEAGADVVKVEATRRRDGARHGPPAFFDLLNAAKRSVALDFTARDDRDMLRRLLLSADVVIESALPCALEQLGLDVAEIAATGELGVWLSITAHGRDEPHRSRVGFGDDASVAGGLVAWDARGPVFCADAAADPASGLVAAAAVIDRLSAGGRWLVDAALARTAALLATGDSMRSTGPAAPPRARRAGRQASALGRDTRAVLQHLARTA